MSAKRLDDDNKIQKIKFNFLAAAFHIAVLKLVILLLFLLSRFNCVLVGRHSVPKKEQRKICMGGPARYNCLQ